MRDKKLLKGLFLCLVLVCTVVVVHAQQAHIYKKKQVIKTYSFGDPNPVPTVMHSREIYPYFTFNGFSFKGEPKKWTVITLENPYIKVYVLPGVGGKVWGAVEKSTGRDFIYHNGVLKFRDIGLRGPWTSGGIEFNFMGVVGHTPSAATPVDYLIKKNKDGSVSCWIGNLSLDMRTYWTVEIRLSKDAAMFKTKAFYYNATPLNQSYYYWSNAAVHIGDSLHNTLQYDYPATYYLRNGAQPWPITKDGRNISYYRNMSPGGGDYFLLGKYANYYGVYWHKYDFGFGHWARYNEMPGKKVFIWGSEPAGAIWEDLLTDNTGQYTEVQTGRLYDQHDLKLFGPMRADRWTGIWFPIKDIGGIDGSSPYAVMNVTQKSNELMVGINALKPIRDTLKVFRGRKLIHKEVVKLHPMGVFKTNVQITSNQGNYIVKLGDQLSVSTNPHGKFLLNRPPPVNNEYDSSTARGLFHIGLKSFERLKYSKAIKSFLKSLQINGNNIRVLTKTAEAYAHKAMYEKASKYARRALAINTYYTEANFIYGVINRRMDNLNQAKVSFGWAARSLKYRSAGYEQMAEINIQQHNWKDAVYYAKEALNFNKINMNAYKVLAIAYRKVNKDKKADKIINKMLEINPLCHFAYFEEYLLNSTDKNLKSFNSLIRHELAYETYLEIAMTYHHMGLDKDAIKVLKNSPSYPIVNFWLAYLNKNHAQKSQKYLHEALTASPKLVFPFRYETIPVLKWALKKNNNWKTKYYLGLIIWSKGRNHEALSLMNACGNNPNFAPFYLTRRKIRKGKNPEKSLQDLQRALKLNKEQWRTYRALTSWYLSYNKPEKAEKISGKAHRRFPNNYYVGVQYANVLLKNNDYKKAYSVLSHLQVLPSEGARRAHSIFEQALTHLAMQNMQQVKFQEALKHLKTSITYPEHLGVGRPHNPDERVQNYLMAQIYEKMDKSEKANSLYQKVFKYSRQLHQEKLRDFNFNNLITLLVYERYGKAQMADNIKKQLIQNLGHKKTIKAWLKAQKNNQESKMKDLRKILLKKIDFKVSSWFKTYLQLKRDGVL